MLKKFMYYVLTPFAWSSMAIVLVPNLVGIFIYYTVNVIMVILAGLILLLLSPFYFLIWFRGKLS